jgi:adenylosuccinate lyase
MIERYQTQAIAAIWSDEARFFRWTRVEVAACKVWHQRGRISDADWRAIATRAHHQSAARVAAIEEETHHDVVAFVRAVAESVGPAGRHIHRALTSSDVIDTALALAVSESLDVVLAAVAGLAAVLRARAEEHAATPCAGRTHGMHAEVTSFGLRLLGFAAEMGRHRERLAAARAQIRFGKMSGAVGTFSQSDPAFEQAVLAELGLQAEPVATQVIPRDRHVEVFTALANLGGGLERIAVEIRSLQRSDLREVQEPFQRDQTGSSAMPHKRNPIISERMTGMARLLRGYAMAALENVALWHDRDISHSAVERVAFPDAFHLAHYMLGKLTHVVAAMTVDAAQMQANIDRGGGLLYSQSVLTALVDAGWARSDAYRAVQAAAAQVWEGAAPHLREALGRDPHVMGALGEGVDACFTAAAALQHVPALFQRVPK